MMPERDSTTQRHLDQLFRQEYGRLVARLIRKLGPGKISYAEDIAQDAMLAAVRAWPFRGVPDNPAAWLQRAAVNRAIDLTRQAKTAGDKRPELEALANVATEADENDLHLLILCCEPSLKEADQLILALNTSFGFTSVEIARLMFVSPTTMAARITRAKKKFAALNTDIGAPAPKAVRRRMPSVLKVLYLAFSIGFSPGAGSRAVEEDTAYAALNAAERLTANGLTSCPECNALAALMCLQASRLQARSKEGRFIPLADQDRSLWDQSLITRGLTYLKRSQAARSLSRYHLEAGIAALHATASSYAQTPWTEICRQYAILEDITGSATVTLNHAVALAMKGDHASAAKHLALAARHCAFTDQVHFLVAKAELARAAGNHDEAAQAYKEAMERPTTAPDLLYLEERLDSLN